MYIPTHIQSRLEQLKYDEEELLLAMYFELKERTDYFHRRALIHDYNVVVKIINQRDPLKHYKEVVA